jgi:hypothetical protein
MTWARQAEADDAAKHSRVSFDIEPHIDALVRLTVTHDEQASPTPNRRL